MIDVVETARHRCQACDTVSRVAAAACSSTGGRRSERHPCFVEEVLSGAFGRSRARSAGWRRDAHALVGHLVLWTPSTDPSLYWQSFRALQALQAYGLFKIGEMVGRRSIVGYSVTEPEFDEEH